jgi:hypothetical protein
MKPIQDCTDEDIARMTDAELAGFAARARRTASNMAIDAEYDEFGATKGLVRTARLLDYRARQAEAELRARGVNISGDRRTS